MPVSLVRGPLSLDIGPHKWHYRAAQLDLLPASSAPSTLLGDRACSDLLCTMPRDMHASWVRGHLSSDIGSLKWPRTAAQMNWFSASTAPFPMLWQINPLHGLPGDTEACRCRFFSIEVQMPKLPPIHRGWQQICGHRPVVSGSLDRQVTCELKGAKVCHQSQPDRGLPRTVLPATVGGSLRPLHSSVHPRLHCDLPLALSPAGGPVRTRETCTRRPKASSAALLATRNVDALHARTVGSHWPQTCIATRKVEALRIRAACTR